MTRHFEVLCLLLLIPAAAWAAGPKWVDDVGAVEVSIASRPVREIPGTHQGYTGYQGAFAALAESGNEAMLRMRKTQGEWSWFRASVEPLDHSKNFRWPEAHCYLVLADSSRAEMVEVIGMIQCGPMMSACRSITLFPQRNEISYRDIEVPGVGDRWIWIAFRIPTTTLVKAEIVDLRWVVDGGVKP